MRIEDLEPGHHYFLQTDDGPVLSIVVAEAVLLSRPAEPEPKPVVLTQAPEASPPPLAVVPEIPAETAPEPAPAPAPVAQSDPLADLAAATPAPVADGDPLEVGSLGEIFDTANNGSLEEDTFELPQPATPVVDAVPTQAPVEAPATAPEPVFEPEPAPTTTHAAAVLSDDDVDLDGPDVLSNPEDVVWGDPSA